MSKHAQEDTPIYTLPQHGAATAWVKKQYPEAPQPLIDLSTGISPYPYPLPAFNHNDYNRLPDPEEINAAIDACHHYYQIKKPARVILSGGMQPLIFALAAKKQNQQVAIVSPTYAEHSYVWKTLGHRVDEYPSLEQVAAGVDVVIFCNPNNPTGEHYSQKSLELLLQKHTPHTHIIIDESYADISPDSSMANIIHDYPHMVILRSMGKFFGLAGMRVSAALAHEPYASFLHAATGAWPISTPSCLVLPALLENKEWQAHTMEKLNEKSIYYWGVLKKYFKVIGHTDLFFLVNTDKADAWYNYLASQGIIVRKFSDHPSWLRFGLPHHSQLERIESALAGFKP